MRVVAVKLAARVALLSDGSTVPVVMLLDDEGDETDITHDAVSFVAGEGSLWFAERCGDYEQAEAH